MAKTGNSRGQDAAEISPKFIPDYQLLGRDDSGGPDYEPYTAQWADGDFKQGAKAHLSASGGAVEPLSQDERDQGVRTGGYKKLNSAGRKNFDNGPATSVKDAKD